MQVRVTGARFIQILDMWYGVKMCVLAIGSHRRCAPQSAQVHPDFGYLLSDQAMYVGNRESPALRASERSGSSRFWICGIVSRCVCWQ